ncbi:uncharacterized protein [Elaeis guineensis]|uniref:uncharacterized protein n=1 Tax=Elaeis guineensis var. tenera TaxID=51953 RepID=UPI003C6D2F79
MRDGQSAHEHCLTMIKDMEELEKLGMSMDKKLQIDMILQSLIDSYMQFIVNYHMNKIQCTKLELLNMLVTTKGTLKSSRDTVLTMERTLFFKRKSTEKKKFVKKQKVENRSMKKVFRKKVAEKGKCFHYNNNGHWKRNCLAYLTSLKNKDGTPSEGS